MAATVWETPDGWLSDAARPGKPAKYDETTERRVLALLDEPPPKGYSQWNGNRVAERLGDVSKDQVWRILRRHDICLQRRRSWCIPKRAPRFWRWIRHLTT